jgi:hypothetical protein
VPSNATVASKASLRDAGQALVAQDAEEPRARLAHTLTLLEHAMRREERGLYGVLGVLDPTEAMPREAQELAGVLLVERSRQRTRVAGGQAGAPLKRNGHGTSVDARMRRI